MTKGLLVITIDIGSLPPQKAEAYMERMTKKLKDGSPEGWNFMMIPVREKGTKVQAFAMNQDEGALEEIKPLILEGEKFVEESKSLQSRERIRDHVMLMLGAPILKLSDRVIEYIDVAIDRAYRYDVNNKQRFVLEEVESVMTATEDIVDIIWDDEDEDHDDDK